MLLGKALCILAFNVVSLTSGVYGFEWPWNWTKEYATCEAICSAAVFSSLDDAVIFFLASLGVPITKIYGWSYSGSVTFLCGAICGSKIEGFKCNYHRIDGMIGLDKNLIKAEKCDNIEKCEGLCNDQRTCRAFRYLSKNNLCFIYYLPQHIADDISESQLYVRRCVVCYMNSTKHAKGRDDEVQSVWEVSSLNKCENKCVWSEDCSAVHFDGERCFIFNDKAKSYEKTGIDFSTKICVPYIEDQVLAALKSDDPNVMI